MCEYARCWVGLHARACSVAALAAASSRSHAGRRDALSLTRRVGMCETSPSLCVRECRRWLANAARIGVIGVRGVLAVTMPAPPCGPWACDAQWIGYG